MTEESGHDARRDERSVEGPTERGRRRDDFLELFVPLEPTPSSSELPQRFPSPFDSRGPHPLAERAANQLKEELLSKVLIAEQEGFAEGKMFAVLVGKAPDGRIGYLRGFSGMLQGSWHRAGFVPPMFEEAAREPWWSEAKEQMRLWEEELQQLTSGPEVTELHRQWAVLRARQEREMAELRQRHQARKAARRQMRLAARETGGKSETCTGGGHPFELGRALPEQRSSHPAASRESGGCTGGGHPSEANLEQALAQESRGDGAERKRLEGAQRAERAEVERRVAEVEVRREGLARMRAERSAGYQRRLHDLYWVPGGVDGEVRPLREFFAPGAPPGGAGDCAGPKLIGYALRHGVRPIALAELWWGPPPLGGGRHHGQLYPACRGKCGPILPYMLSGIEVEEAPVFGASGTDELALEEERARAEREMGGARSDRGDAAQAGTQGIGPVDEAPGDVPTAHLLESGEATSSSSTVRGDRLSDLRGADAGAAAPLRDARADIPTAHLLKSGGATSSSSTVRGDRLADLRRADVGAAAPLRDARALEVVHEDEWLVVVAKPSGLLSVPGRTAELQDSVLSRLRQRYPEASGLLVHRLDLDTSGLLLAAKDRDTHAALQRMFLQRTIEKRYVALLDGEVAGARGTIELALRTDLDDRPRQLHDPVHGRPAITDWRVVSRDGGVTRVHFFPRTGRTHQLRVHAAHPQGLGAPIVGDRLYSRSRTSAHQRLMLHAEQLGFVHPRTGQRLELFCEAPY